MFLPGRPAERGHEMAKKTELRWSFQVCLGGEWMEWARCANRVYANALVDTWNSCEAAKSEQVRARMVDLYANEPAPTVQEELATANAANRSLRALVGMGGKPA